MSTGKEILFYDIASAPPVTTFAPNPSKTRYALNFKGVNYRTEWTKLPKVAETRKRLGTPPNRTHMDGSPFYTLPVIHDLSTGAIVGDTFDIAVYLDETYPDTGPRLIPAESIGTLAAFNIQIDALFTNNVLLCVSGFPFDPETAEESKTEMARRVGRERWEELLPAEEDRPKMMEAFEASLAGLVKIFRRRDEGPFLEGAQATYADMIIGGWLRWTNKTVKKEEWEKIAAWHGGLWGNLFNGLEERYTEMK
ncbi:hypothetical protein BDV98DRAFT_564448 [Pterulicium gracile]|uniref:Uncharacterized protein n=1 Tax=Pterulicium gracile TaxID=1884261 RepID=A0A5C3QRW7_9AGAR|nr:hypothetical protein BDV98DRAFT_564448 [Pterula gracilis]